MSKHPIDHDRKRDDSKVAQYARIEREQADKATDPKVKAMTRASHGDETAADDARMKAFLKKDRQTSQP